MRLPSRLVFAYAGVIAVTLAVMCVGGLLVLRALSVATASQAASDSARTRLAAANEVLGYAVHIGSSPDSLVPGQFALALHQSVAAWQGAQSSATEDVTALVGSSADGTRYEDLRAQSQASFNDMFVVANAIMSAVASGMADSQADRQAAVTRLAAKEGAYADAVKAEAAYFDAMGREAAIHARVEAALFASASLVIFLIGIFGLIAPAHRRAATSVAQAIRIEEQRARIGAEVARHAAERDGREAEAQFQALFRHASMGVALADERDRILESNGALQRMLGYSEKELRGTQFGEWAVPTSAPAGERVFRRKDGSTFWVEQSTTVVHGTDERNIATIWMVQDIEERKAAEARLQHDATHDSLTALFNRGHFDQFIDRAVDSAARDAGQAFTVFMIDLDRFKIVNDTRGHAVGDAVLTEVGRRLAAWAQSEIIVARYGGDEFAALMRGPSQSAMATDAATCLLRILDRPMAIGGMSMRISASVGLCRWAPEFANGDAIMRAADTAAFRAKALGRSRVIAYDSSMAKDDDLRRRVGLELRTAIDNNQMSLVYQPIVSLPDRRCIGFETLARWHHPELGRVSPSIFISVAEEIGLATEIGAWVLQEACTQLADWQRRLGREPLKLNVNASSQQMADPTFANVVRAALRESGVRLGSLVLELTETAMLDGGQQSNETLAEIRAMGVPIVLDDFGTGYSSLSYLQRLPIDALKIDQSFIKGPSGGLAAPAIVHALIALAKTLGINVVAEGVETEEQSALLVEMGCPTAQGYLFSRPLDADSAFEFFSQSCREYPLAVDL
jgi:diguanylate cyclase (GGDEF)-like protein